MEISPVIQRELRLALNRHKATKVRLIFASLGVALAIIALLVNSQSFSGFIHMGLLYIGLYAVVMGPGNVIIEQIIHDRENHVIGFLFLAGVSPREHFWSKISSTILITLPNLMALAPPLAVTFLEGGISLKIYLATLICLPVTLIFSIAVGCFCASFWEQQSSAIMGFYSIMTAICGIPIGLYESLTVKGLSLSHIWRLFSPAWGPRLVHAQGAAGSISDFYINCAITILWSILLIWLAGKNMKSEWQREFVGYEKPTLRHSIQNWLRGSKAWRLKQNHWLDINPYTWLTIIHRQTVILGWIILVGSVFLTGTLYAILPTQWFGAWLVTLMGSLTALAIEWLLNYAAADRIAQDRRSQAFELILTTPLQTHELIRGEREALSQQFYPLFMGCLLINLCLMTFGFFMIQWNICKLISYLSLWSVILVVNARHYWPSSYTYTIKAAWAGLNTAQPALSVSKAWNFNGWNFVNFWNFYAYFPLFPSGHWIEIAILTAVAACYFGYLIYRKDTPDTFSIHLENKMQDDLIFIAAEPIPDPKDEQLKKWNIHNPLYQPHP